MVVNTQSRVEETKAEWSKTPVKKEVSVEAKEAALLILMSAVELSSPFEGSWREKCSPTVVGLEG